MFNMGFWTKEVIPEGDTIITTYYDTTYSYRRNSFTTHCVELDIPSAFYKLLYYCTIIMLILSFYCVFSTRYNTHDKGLDI